ncbi:hypothetical protein [Draconibacterium sediminis]|uniref:Lipocalin-like domain-containing protein n=1 Tax=Draconibacterium sediminis TaxID=1544798 RepID=A0A0D8J585_9BACT|nr:hypothetical protein [Draconibacterium sediminis]KJF42067.1 hypothetical protein LH29_22585 [Draconibacterium sediminis]
MNISGNWTYNEDFEYGNSVGEVELIQTGDEVSGIFSFTEEVKNNYSIQVTEKVKGTLADGKLLLESVEVKALQNGREISYLPNTFETHRITETQIIGSTYDSEDVCGVFVLERKV